MTQGESGQPARRALVIVGKAPLPGATKTRLCPPLSTEQAASLYGGFLCDTVAMALRLGWEQVTLVYPPRPGADEELRALLAWSTACPKAADQPRLVPQAQRGLGAALAGAFASHLAEGFERVVLIGSDNPTLPSMIVDAAERRLDDCDLVIGPSSDGGYYLIGMSSPHLAVFERITWSTDAVYRQTLRRAHDHGLRVGAVEEWYDVDTAAELERLRSELTDLPGTVAPNTRRVLERLRW